MKKKVLSLMMTLMLGFFGLAQAQVSLPYNDGFENGIGEWTMSNCHSSTGLSTTTSYVHSGSSSFTFHWTTTPPQYLISPQLSGVTGSLNVEFYYKAGSSGSYSETFMVGYSTTTADVSSFTFGEEITAVAGDDWALYSISFPTGTKYIAIECISNDAFYLCLDDFAFTTSGGGGGSTTMYDFEDGTTQGWTTIDADGDGFNWALHAPDPTYVNDVGHDESSYYFNSASYDNETSTALTPNNFLVSPQVTLGGTISFWAQAQDPNYAAEHFGVAVSTTSATNPSAFTTIQEWTMTAKSNGVPGNHKTRSGSRTTNTWYEYTVNLSDYAGQNGYVAIRHFNCTDQFVLNIDDITIVEGGSGGQTYTITATPNPLEGGYVTIAYRDVRTVVFSDDFETGIDNWTLIDADGDGNNWYDLIDNNPNNIPGHNGSVGFATSASYSGSALTPDNYLVSPQVALNGTFSFWACSQDDSWAAEHFGVAVSTTNATEASAFTTIQEWTLSAKSGSGVLTSETRNGMTRDQGAWHQFTVDLSSYAGQMGYIAIRHFNCTDMFRINVDDVELITNDGGQTGETVSATFEEGQTCILTAHPFSGYYFVNWTENGAEVSTSAVYSFPVTCDRNLVANFQFYDGVGEQTNINITLFPNPVSNKLTVEASEVIDHIEIFNTVGAMVYSQKNSSEKVEIQTADLPVGTYVIRMTTQSTTEVRRFVKK